MSLLGFNAVGRLALGQIGQAGPVNISMPAAPGAFALAGVAVTFKLSEAVTAGGYVLAGVAAGGKITETAAPGAFALSLKPATFGASFATAPGAFTLTGYAANEPVVEDADPGAFLWTGNDAPLIRTGLDYDFQQGGIGHYLEELERVRQLQRITRNPGVPIDRRSRPRFQPIGRPLVAPPVPAVDVQAIARERMAAQMAAVAAQKKRRDEEALLLLAC
ncbi:MULTISPECIES: hypothetical protein [unclassified Bradyrhizobium]|jgi:hypothetical protein|uniref:hypothetical protein n=1 Tax=unclassified Bradyrhizobium TaxID=2631580 RepID=UPI001BAA3491|nr:MULTISPECIES: hypothetical protein [unclassified Bradyrhizobium]MBR1206609.1 hypothetical protein [Bradyrhizobium sp. AUGA SZCCT0124]MBR1315413.1 hypothetical protein [Bradyrhizobium sp. AUGA SZCCT0051]MBR1338525.1 hypothetical protein [Bradyrhizobium sp. AUGA SZCCT0105]MBR1356180.1 hypothetical protein [Bradyrhizobium sp. AUGA SZCCT0045]